MPDDAVVHPPAGHVADRRPRVHGDQVHAAGRGGQVEAVAAELGAQPLHVRDPVAREHHRARRARRPAVPTRCAERLRRGRRASRPDSACGVTSSRTSTSTSPARATSTTREVFACPNRRLVVITCSRCVPAASAAGVPRNGPLAQNACSSRPSSEATTSACAVPRQNRLPRHQAGSRSSSAAAYSTTAYGVKETSRTQVPPGRSSSRAVVSSPAGTSRTVTSRPSSSHRSFMRPTLGAREVADVTPRGECSIRAAVSWTGTVGPAGPISSASGQARVIHRAPRPAPENGIRVAPGRTTLLASLEYPPWRTPAPARPCPSPTSASPPRSSSVLTEAGITAPFPIQTATLPDSLAGRDVLGRGRTGSGKTYAFVLPLLARLAAGRGKRQPGRPRALVLAPTRELASQIEAAMAPLAKALGLRTLTIFGGVRPNPQIQGLRNGVDIVIACPGRLADHVQSGHCDLDAIEITVLDEADHMADLGFLPVVRRLLDKTPERRPAAAVLGHPGRRRRRAGQALPARPGHAQRRLGAVAGRAT